MVFEFKFPDVGEGITEGKLIKWLVKVGDTIKVDQSVAEVETDKAVVQIPSPVNGVVSKLLYKEQDTVIVGKVLMEIDSENANENKEVKSQKNNIDKREEIIQKTNNSENANESNNEILALPAVRKYAKDNNIDLSSIKGTGVDKRILMEDLKGKTAKDSKMPTKSIIKDSLKPLKHVLASPSTRQLARTLNVDINEVEGTGNLGIITKEDITKASKQIKEGLTNTNNVSTTKESLNDEEDSTIVPMSSIRQTIASRMVESKHKAAHVTLFEQANVTELVALRDKEKEAYAKKGIKLTYLAFFTKAVLLALKQHPYLNSVMDEENNTIILKNYYNIGIAVDTEKGLLVPVIKSANKKSIVEIANEIGDLASKSRDAKLSIENMSEGTFTISSIGNMAGEGFTPVINYPQAAILGIGRIKDKPIVKKNKIVLGKMVTFSLSFDHRILDGAQASRFIQTLVRYVENPSELFMEMI